MTSSLVLLSGGPDSFTAGGWAVRNRHRVEGLWVDAGQHVAAVEREHAHRHGATLGIPMHELDISSTVHGLQRLGSSGLSVFKGAGLPLVPFSPEIALSVAFAAAASLGLDELVIGLHADDSGHPDYTPQAIASMSETGRRHGVELTIPLRPLTKSAVVELGMGFGLDIADSWSCTDGSTAPCDQCIPCVQRREALATAALRHPLRRGSHGA